MPIALVYPVEDKGIQVPNQEGSGKSFQGEKIWLPECGLQQQEQLYRLRI
jgi:hypothetical protein